MCPPGVDQTTRFQQQWHLIVPKLRQRQRLSLEDEERHWPPRDGPQNYLRTGTSSWGAFWKLARLSTIAHNEDIIDTDLNVTTSTKLSLLETLPAELLNMTLSDGTLSKQDILALGACSKTLFTHVLSHIRQDCQKTVATWAATPLACTGTWLTDLPPGFYEHFPEQVPLEHNYQTRSGKWYGACPARRFNWDIVSESHDVDGQDCGQKWLQALKSAPWTEQISPAILHQLCRDVEMTLSSQFAVTRPHWILRNLTAHQYVRLHIPRTRSSEIAAHVHVQGAPWLTLDQALILRITWGAKDGYNDRIEAHEEALLRGSWAGNCFDVIQEDCRGKGVGGWEDVTDQLVEDGKVWRADGFETVYEMFDGMETETALIS